MKFTRNQIMTYMVLIILILALVLGLLSQPSKEGLETKPATNITPNAESDIQPKKYRAELYQVKDKDVDLPTFGAVPQEIFNPDTAYYINAVSFNKPDAEYKSAIFKIDKPTSIALNMETKRGGSVIVLAPQDGGKFPKKFTFTLTNFIAENKLSMDLWGTSPTMDNAPSNSIIGSDNYKSFPYPDDLFKTKDEDDKMIDGIMTGSVNIGNNALNVIGVGRIFDRNFKDIGEVQNMNDTITVTCNDSTGLTGMLFYLGNASSE